MNGRITYLILFGILISGCSVKKNPGLIIACGWDEVFISDISMDVPGKVWSWTADSSSNMPVSLRNKFQTTDECKSYEDGSQILIASSGGGVALVERESKDLLFTASLPNAHSAELLPGERVVVAASYSPEGNRISVYDMAIQGPLVTFDTLTGAHGVVWDSKRERLWALGDYELRCYILDDWDGNSPSLVMDRSYTLPDYGGHDLVFLDSRSELTLSTLHGVWQFDIAAGEFRPHPVIGQEENVKSLSGNPVTGEVAFVRSGDEGWWAYYIRFVGSDRVVYLPYEKIYKVRWLY